MVVSKDMDEETREKLRDFLVSYDNQDYFKLVIKNENARFVECSMEDYEPVVELNKNINAE